MEQASTLSAPWRASAIAKKIAAGAILAASALLFYYVTDIPLAVDLPADTKWNAALVDEMVISPLGSGRQALLSIDGKENEGADVRFDEARLRDESAQMFRSEPFNLDLPVTQGRIEWLSAQKGSGRTSINISVEPGQGMPEVRIAHIGESEQPGMRLSARNAAFIVELAVLKGDSDEPLEQRNLRIGTGPVHRIPGASPLTVVVPEGRAFAVTFPTEKPGSTLRVGDPMEGRGVPLRYLGISKSGSDSYSTYACATKPGNRFWAPRSVRGTDCSIASNLRMTRFGLSSDSMSANLAGTAFVATDGVWTTDGWFNFVEKNKPLAGFLGLVFAALAKWVWGAFFPGGKSEK